MRAEPSTLTSKARRQSSSEPCSSVPKTASSAATCTSASIARRSASRSPRRDARSCASSPMSAGHAATRRPEGSRSLAICSSFAAVRAASTTFAPVAQRRARDLGAEPGADPGDDDDLVARASRALLRTGGRASYHAPRSRMLGRSVGARTSNGTARAAQAAHPGLHDALHGRAAARTRSRAASGEVLEVGFGTARNLEHYGAERHARDGPRPDVDARACAAVEERIARARFPVERTHAARRRRAALRRARASIASSPPSRSARSPIRRRRSSRCAACCEPGGRYVFIEHGRSRERGHRALAGPPEPDLAPRDGRLQHQPAVSTRARRCTPASRSTRSTASSTRARACSRRCTGASPRETRASSRLLLQPTSRRRTTRSFTTSTMPR